MYNFNVNKLNGKIVEMGMTKEGLAESIGIDRSTFFRRLKNNKLLLSDAHRICEALQLTKEDAINIFLGK
jgi:DNA-binding Xre family transcriptional regulator